MSLASFDTYNIIGITTAIAFVVYFFLGMLVATLVGHMVKGKSKPAVQNPAVESVYEMVESSQKISEVEEEANTA